MPAGIVHGRDPAARAAHRRRLGRHAAVRLPQPVHRPARGLRHRPRARRSPQAIFGDPNRVEYKVLTYAQRIPALLDGSVDIVADVMTVNCERWAADLVLVAVLRRGPEDPRAHRLAGHRHLAAQRQADVRGDGLDQHRQPEELPRGRSSCRSTTSPTAWCCSSRATVDSVTGDDTVLAGFVAQDPYAKIVGAALTSEPYGLGRRQDASRVRPLRQRRARRRCAPTARGPQMYRSGCSRPAPCPPRRPRSTDGPRDARP